MSGLPTAGQTTLDVAPTLTQARARALTDEVKADAAALWAKLLALYQGGAHTALGYASWAAYCAAEFDLGRSHAYRLLDAGRVAEAIQAESPDGGTEHPRSRLSLDPLYGDTVPVTERVARELVPLLGDERQVVEVWRNLRAEHGDRLTAEKVRDAVTERLRRDAVERIAARPAPPLPTTSAYRTIVVDPPWDIKAGPGWASNGRSRVLPYPTMTVEEIAALPVRDLADDHAHLYLWVVNRYLPDVYDIVRGWGFEHSTTLAWCKPPHGLGLGGAYVQTTEAVVFARRGTCPASERVPSTWFAWPRRSHSEKPHEFFEMVERVSPAPRIELFARCRRPGWVAWGNELEEASAS